MADQFDVIVVGGRCAGASLATLLAGAGNRVAVVERAAFPRDTLSCTCFEADALAFLDRLGLTDRLRATGARFADRTELRVEDLHLPELESPRPGSHPAEAAAEAGAAVRPGNEVTDLVEEGGRLTGPPTSKRDASRRCGA